MSLPELEWQIIYGRLAWALVLAALIIAVLGTWYRLSRRQITMVVAGIGLLQALPHEYSPAYWLGLAFQMPSGLLTGLCLVGLRLAWRGKPVHHVLIPTLAGCIVFAGAALYLDAIGLLARGYYYWGFGPRGAPVLAIVLAAACSIAVFRNYARPQAFALLAALALFSVLRLPTGNLWDALIDPLLVLWALVALVRALKRWSQRRGLAGAPATGGQQSIQ